MRDIVDIIGDLKYEINNTLKLQEKSLMFQPSFEDNKRMKILGKPCTTEADMQTFSTTLYTVIYEETKVGKVCKATLGGYKNHPFTYYVSELRHYYDHGFAEYVSTKKIKVSDVFKRYLKKAVAPKTAEEFQTIQRGILNDFIDFLNAINERLSSNSKNPKESKKSKKSAFNIKPTIPLKERVKVEIDSDNLAHAGNVYIGAKKKCKKGDVVVILKVGNNPTPEIAKKYPLVAKEMQKVVDNNGIAKIYTVAVDSKGLLHADNILISEKTKCKEGDRIMILQAKENNAKRTQQAYPLFAANVVVLNLEIPNVEEKATIIVSKFDKYIVGPLKWFGDAIIAIIKKLLGKNNLILR